MTRFLLSLTAAAMLLAPVVTQAATTPAPAGTMAATPAKPMAAKPAKPAMRRMAARPAARRDAGSAAVDALNDQALARARAGQ